MGDGRRSRLACAPLGPGLPRARGARDRPVRPRGQGEVARDALPAPFRGRLSDRAAVRDRRRPFLQRAAAVRPRLGRHDAGTRLAGRGSRTAVSRTVPGAAGLTLALLFSGEAAFHAGRRKTRWTSFVRWPFWP